MLTYVLFPVLKVKQYILTGHVRSIAMKKNIISSFVLKGTELSIGFVRVAIILSFINNTDYGLWLTVSSFVGWFTFLDLGLGNGLLNKLTEALSRNDYESAKRYLSTAYFSLSVIMGGFYLIFLLFYPFINWQAVTAPNETANPYLNILVLISFTSFALHSVLNLISTVLKADQKYAYGQSIGLAGSIIYLFLLLICSRLLQGNLLILSLIAYVPPLLCYFLVSIILYRKRYNLIKPSLRYVNRGYIKELAKLGIKFFVIQIAAIVIFATDNVIIAQLGRVSDVVPYNISRYYFGFASMAFGLVLAPLWPAFTDAYVKNDIIWIKRITRKIIYLWFVLVAVVAIMYLLSGRFYSIWLGEKIEVPGKLTFIMGLSVIITSWNLPFVYFINGIGKIKLQLYNSIVVMILNVPLSILFARSFSLGTTGVILSTCICLLIGSIWVPIQYCKIVNKKAEGIWNE